jgi:transcriptional regulator with XRE-family HTH domain
MGDYLPLGSVVRKAREAKGLSLSEASSRIGITKAHLWQIETGRNINPKASTLIGMMAVLKVSAARILEAVAASQLGISNDN